MTTPPKTQYARSGSVHIAYQAVGEGGLMGAAGSTRAALFGISEGGRLRATRSRESPP